MISGLLAIGVLALINWPRLSESLWNDEIWSLEESIHGSWHRDLESASAEEALTKIYWDELGWQHAIWRYDTTNHHFLLNVLAKGGNSAKHSGADFWNYHGWDFDEAALRFLPFCCALGGLLAWARLLARLGFPTGGAILPWILALHPWYQQLATGMRGYALVFLFLPLALGFLVGALRSNRWRSWLAFALFQFLLVYSWPPAAGLMFVVSLCAAVAILRSRAERVDQLKRLAVANLMTGMILIPLVGPAFYQIGGYLQNEVVREDMGAAWNRDLGSLFYLGCFWQEFTDFTQRAGGQVSGESIFRQSPFLFCTVAVVGLLAGLRGTVAAIRKNRPMAILFFIGLLLPPVASYIKGVTAQGGEDVYLFHWYFIYALPALCGLVAIGLGALGDDITRRFLDKPHLRLVSPIALTVVALGLYSILASPRTTALRNNSVDPRRESVEATRGALDLADPANAKIVTAHVFRDALCYDPLGWRIDTKSNLELPQGSPPGLIQLMSIADRKELTLYVNVGLPSVAREKYPGIMEMVDDTDLFVLHSEHFGLEPHFERAVYRYHGKIFSFDFSRPKS